MGLRLIRWLDERKCSLLTSMNIYYWRLAVLSLLSVNVEERKTWEERERGGIVFVIIKKSGFSFTGLTQFPVFYYVTSWLSISELQQKLATRRRKKKKTGLKTCFATFPSLRSMPCITHTPFSHSFCRIAAFLPWTKGYNFFFSANSITLLPYFVLFSPCVGWSMYTCRRRNYPRYFHRH